MATRTILPNAARTELAAALRDVANATRADRRAHFEVGRILVNLAHITDKDIAAGMREDGFDRSKGWYSQVRTAYLNAIVRGGLSITEAAWDRGTEDKPGGVGPITAFYSASNKISDEDMPTFVANWIRGISPEREESTLTKMSCTKDDAKVLRAYAKANGMTEVELLAAFAKEVRVGA